MAWDFWRVRFWSRDFLGIIGIVLLIFAPIQSFRLWNSEYPRSDATIIDTMGPFI